MHSMCVNPGQKIQRQKMEHTNIQPEISEQTQSEDSRGPIGRTVRTLTFASIGAVSIGREEAKRLLDRLVERGEADVKHARNSMQQAKTKQRELRKKVSRRKTNPASSEAVNLPTRTEMDALREQLAKLSQELAELHSNGDTPADTVSE